MHRVVIFKHLRPLRLLRNTHILPPLLPLLLHQLDLLIIQVLARQLGLILIGLVS